MRKKLRLGAVIGTLLLATLSIQQSFADSDDIHHVLLISIDGFHVLDYLNCGRNGGNPTARTWRRWEPRASTIWILRPRSRRIHSPA